MLITTQIPSHTTYSSPHNYPITPRDHHNTITQSHSMAITINLPPHISQCINAADVFHYFLHFDITIYGTVMYFCHTQISSVVADAESLESCRDCKLHGLRLTWCTWPTRDCWPYRFYVVTCLEYSCVFLLTAHSTLRTSSERLCCSTSRSPASLSHHL